MHALPSLHARFDTPRWKQPVAESQPSAVHTLPSSQLVGIPFSQDPSLHVVFVVQALPSSQAPPDNGVFWHPSVGWQPSVVQSLPSSHVGPAPGLHVPPPQTSPTVQALPSSQGSVL